MRRGSKQFPWKSQRLSSFLRIPLNDAAKVRIFSDVTKEIKQKLSYPEKVDTFVSVISLVSAKIGRVTSPN